MGKTLQFHRKVEENSESKRIKPFHRRINNRNQIICFMKLKQFKEPRTSYIEDYIEEVQANKSTGRMPWHQEPMKDATSCDKLR